MRGQRGFLSNALLTHAEALLGMWLERDALVAGLRFDGDEGGDTWSDRTRSLLSHALRRPVTPPPFSRERSTGSRRAPARDQHVHEGWSAQMLWDRFDLHVRKALVDNDPAALRWHTILQRHQLVPVEAQLLAFLAALQVDQALQQAWCEVTRCSDKGGLTWGVLIKLLSDRKTWEHVAATLDPDRSWLFRAGLVSLDRKHDTPLSATPVHMSWDVARCLLGWSVDDPALLRFERVAAPPKRLYKQVVERWPLEAPPPHRVAFIMPYGPSAVSLAADYALRFGGHEGLWVLNLAAYANPSEAHEALAKARRMSALLNTIVVIAGTDQCDDPSSWVIHVQHAFAHLQTPLCWIWNASPPATLRIDRRHQLMLGLPRQSERFETWRRRLPEAPEERCMRLARSFLVSEDDITALAANVRPQDLADDEHYGHLIDACHEVVSHHLMVPLTGGATLAQLNIPDDLRNALAQLVQAVEAAPHANVLSLMPLRRGTSALFSCAFPRAGRRTVQALAHALDREVYRMDLRVLFSVPDEHFDALLDRIFILARPNQAMLYIEGLALSISPEIREGVGERGDVLSGAGLMALS